MKKSQLSVPIEINVRRTARRVSVQKKRLVETAVKIVKALGWKRAALSVLLVDDREIMKWNYRYLNHRRATDVIAFPQQSKAGMARAKKGTFADPEGRPFLGDLMISLETARKQAKTYGNSFFYEVCFYLCHGILHLMGEIDKTKRDAEKMAETQKRILEKIGINP